MLLQVLVLSGLLADGQRAPLRADPPPPALPAALSSCPGIRLPVLLGLLARPLTLTEMVNELERGCLALDVVRFRPGQDTLESLLPSQLALVARALGMAHGAYRVTVPPEAAPGWPPDTLQARRRGARLRDELVRFGASAERLLEGTGWPLSTSVAAPGKAIPMLVRVSDP